MKVLLDTHVLLWAAAEPERLRSGGQLMLDAELRLISAATAWELAIKQSLGKLRLAEDVRSWLPRAVRELDAQILPITAEHAAAVEHLPMLHRDPFDRLLVAQAMHERAVLLTADPILAGYGDVVRLV